jgi:protein-tyrosine phosphatase
MNMQRHYNFPGLINFRDLGDYAARDLDGKARRVKSGVLFRAGHFHDVDAAAHNVLADLGILQVFDFRTARELDKKPSRLQLLPAPVTHWLELDPGSGNTFKAMLKPVGGATLTASEMKAMMADVNRSLVTDHADVYRRFMAALLENPVCSVMHCASGKDRTGIAAALLLSALGVDRDTIISDYLLTNQCLDVQHHVARAMADFGNQPLAMFDAAALTAMYEVQPEYLQAAFDAIDSQWGSIDNYLQDQLGIGVAERQQLQQRYLT